MRELLKIIKKLRDEGILLISVIHSYNAPKVENKLLEYILYNNWFRL